MLRLLAASLLCTSVAQAQLATAIGIVVDSVRGRPLVGATIVVSGAEVQGVSDSTGRFRIDSIPPGVHTMAVLHPYLDELGIQLTTNKITFTPGGSMAVVLATPSAQNWIARRCNDAERQEGAGAVIGHVLQLTGDDPVTGSLIHYTGTFLLSGKDIGLRHTTITRDASASSTGDFTVCGVPPGALGSIRATKGRVSTGDLPVDLSDSPLAVVTLRLAPDDTLATHVGVVNGRIVDTKGAPVPEAHVTLRGGPQTAQSTDSGTFTMHDLPLGSQVLEIDKVGFPKQATPVTVLGPQQPTIVSIALLAPPPRSDEARLVGVGFVRRRLAGKGGVFLARDTIVKLKARYIADLQGFFPQTFMSASASGPILVPTTSSMARCLWYLVDNMPYIGGWKRFNDEVPASSIVGIEYYTYGQVPKELQDRFMYGGIRRCALLAIWTESSVGAPAS